MGSLQILKNVEWKSPISKGHILCDFLYITLFNTILEMKNRLVAAKVRIGGGVAAIKV